MMTTLTTMPSSSEGKRNKKTKALNGLLSATALGLFLEGCGSTSTSATESCTLNGRSVDCSVLLREAAPSPAASAEALAQGGGQENAELLAPAVASASALEVEGAELSAENVDNLVGGSDADTLNGGEGVDTTSYANSDEGDEVDPSVDNEENLASTEDDTDVVAQNFDIIEGTNGNDVLQGGAGANVYVFNEGDGEDTVVEVAEEGVVNTLKFEGDYEASDFSFERSSEDGKDLVIIADTDGDGTAENEVTLENYFTSETGTEIAYSIVVQINDGEAFAPSLEG